MSFKSAETREHKEHDRSGRVVIFSDLDGTMLDNTSHGFATVSPVLQQARERHIPLSFVTSKTFTEIEKLQKSIGLWQKESFITENGHGIFIPKGYFHFPLPDVVDEGRLSSYEGFDVIVSSKTAEESRKSLHLAAEKSGVPIETFTQMSLGKFMSATGFTSEDDAKRALERMFTEGFSILLPKEEKEAARQKLREKLHEEGFDLTTGGLFESVMKEGVSKGEAVSVLKKLYKREYGEVTTIGIGDAPNDIPFLKECDKGYLVANPHKVAETGEHEGLIMIPEIGPEGWNNVVSSLLFTQE